MAHSQEGPHSGQIRLKDGTRINATKTGNRWTAAGQTVKTGLFFGDDLALNDLERVIEAKRKGKR
jgi:hypothetical protein